jgi:hypothetical protein
MLTRIWSVAAAALVVSCLAAAPAPQGGKPEIDPALFAAFNRSELAFTAKVAKVVYGPVALSEPPIYSLTLTFKDGKALRGELPADLTFSYSKKQSDKPVFKDGAEVLVAAVREPAPGKGARISEIVPATAAGAATAKLGLSIPVGWVLENGKPVSPWSSLGDRAKIPGMKADQVCAISGRPALLAGQGIRISVEQVLPKEVKKFQNPFGDGEFKVTVTNAGKEAVEVRALLADGGKILWDDSLVFLEGGRHHVLPPSGAAGKVARGVTLKPGESVTGVVNTLRLRGVPWPRGGSRVNFQFCLGELTAQNFFYYYSKLHDAMRDAAQK